MNKVKVVKADTKKTMNDFVALPRYIYKDCSQYVPDVDMDVRATVSSCLIYVTIYF